MPWLVVGMSPLRLQSCHVWLECISLFVFAIVNACFAFDGRPLSSRWPHFNDRGSRERTVVRHGIEAVKKTIPNLDASVTEATEQLKTGDFDTDINPVASRSHRCAEISSLLLPDLKASCTGLVNDHDAPSGVDRVKMSAPPAL